MTPSPSLLYMPDISGFTAFVHETELEHSQHIISDLLETLIDADELNLTVAEVEGDAVLFYKEGPLPSPEQVVVQAHHMFEAFHDRIASFVATCTCSCAACQTVNNLTLKVIAHAGPLGFTTVRQQRKPFGETVIVLHRLLKNDIAKHEYVLLTDALLKYSPPTKPFSTIAHHRCASCAELGEVGYVYLPLRRPPSN